ncbi:hypothetical protein BC831DRAFT_467125 [Entophlyctis helioformis]|nr:hypothetical protein BC831DRAFT_467125 [Entophlyctis helioformis]
MHPDRTTSRPRPAWPRAAVLLCLAAAALVALATAPLPASASPVLRDVHRTRLQLIRLPEAAAPGAGVDSADASDKGLASAGDEATHFAVNVVRFDALLDSDKNDSPVASRLSHVLLRFDVDTTTDGGKVLVNNVPVEMGISHVKVTAKTLVGVSPGTDYQKAVDAFDEGIVDVQISVSGAQVRLANGDTVRRIIIAERIMQVNGKDVAQDDRVQQVIEILPNGSVRRSRPHHESEGSASAVAATLDMVAAGGRDAPIRAQHFSSDNSDQEGYGTYSETLDDDEEQSSDNQEEADPVDRPHHECRGKAVLAAVAARFRCAYSAVSAWISELPQWGKMLVCLATSLVVALTVFGLVRSVALLFGAYSVSHSSTVLYSRVPAGDLEGQDPFDSDSDDDTDRKPFTKSSSSPRPAVPSKSASDDTLPAYTPIPASDDHVDLKQ